MCWECQNHHIPADPLGSAPETCPKCGSQVEFSGQLTAYDPDTGVIKRTWDEMPAVHDPGAGVQAEITEDAYEMVGA